MSLVARVKEASAAAINSLYGTAVTPEEITINQTKPEFEGDYTVVLFALVKSLRKSPEALGQELGARIVADNPGLFTAFNVIKGFLNLTLADAVLLEFLRKPVAAETRSRQNVIVEYSSPNTNKPLHLGHLRNNFLGWSVAEILKAAGNEVRKACIVNDRGIHICKSMIAWQMFANGATPRSAGQKGDHFVGDYYVRFENELKAQTEPVMERLKNGKFDTLTEAQRVKAEAIYKNWANGDRKGEAAQKALDGLREIARASTPIMKEAQQMLVDWEAGKPEVMSLWKQMNSWVYEGFDATYKRIGTDFDKIYYESDTYLLGRDLVKEGLEKGVFYRKEDGSVWIDLTAEGLDEKLVLRKDGTSVYITQDMGLAQQKYEWFPYDQSLYVIADEQNYHMKVLQLILKKLGAPYADGIHHLSYGMVELPTGRMKSREGTVVDADDLVNEMVKVAEAETRAHSKVEEFSEGELKELYETIALGALKFFLLHVDPKKKMLFNPEETIKFQGFTGPFIQYTHARIRSILRKAGDISFAPSGEESLLPKEKELLLLIEQYGSTVQQAATEYNPSVIANYAFTLAKTYNGFYSEHSVLNAESEAKKWLRLELCRRTSEVLKAAMSLLGIRVPERM
ncbi:arginine--tRNA ligase [Flaviaesturariibacter flavus]|uniref:Arginine--tRNA ligase n=1 Tax=Flaviaesturariibacter flavus TaxID=2502780 RepID=A0A4R1BGZ9_9BACT|nr:arginine--tRNA ligase [Flaviaesturariibacter flavus]TCJ16535.1 arginine--tRNA ligase [Flaviaesturariibacter flavus]